MNAPYAPGHLPPGAPSPYLPDPKPRSIWGPIPETHTSSNYSYTNSVSNVPRANYDSAACDRIVKQSAFDKYEREMHAERAAEYKYSARAKLNERKCKKCN